MSIIRDISTFGWSHYDEKVPSKGLGVGYKRFELDMRVEEAHFDGISRKIWLELRYFLGIIGENI